MKYILKIHFAEAGYMFMTTALRMQEQHRKTLSFSKNKKPPNTTKTNPQSKTQKSTSHVKCLQRNWGVQTTCYKTKIKEVAEKMKILQSGQAAHTFNLSIQEAEANGFLSLKPG